jgi:hypothetical protein
MVLLIVLLRKIQVDGRCLKNRKVASGSIHKGWYTAIWIEFQKPWLLERMCFSANDMTISKE